jgi:hypothetical protein
VQLIASGWAIQDYAQYNPAANRGIALFEISEKRWCAAIARIKKEGDVPTGFGKPTGQSDKA